MKIPEIIFKEGVKIAKEVGKIAKESSNVAQKSKKAVPLATECGSIVGDTIQICKKAERSIAATESPVAKGLANIVKKPYSQTVRELEMVPKYLELATVESAERFNPEEIKLITSKFKKYKSNACLTDVLKEILDIGTKKGEPMTAREISLYLNATTKLPKQEQENILKLVRAIKERQPVKYDANFIDEFWTYEKYKDLRHIKSDFIKESEDEIRKSYSGFLEREKWSATNEYYRNYMSGGKINLETEIFTPETTKYLRKYASKVNEPELLSQLMLLSFPKNVLYCAEPLEKIYKLSNNNLELACDIAQGFVFDEIYQIETLLKDLKPETLKSYTSGKAKDAGGLLKYFGLNGKVKMYSRHRLYDDAIHHTVSGNYEGGKRRR